MRNRNVTAGLMPKEDGTILGQKITPMQTVLVYMFLVEKLHILPLH